MGHAGRRTTTAMPEALGLGLEVGVLGPPPTGTIRLTGVHRGKGVEEQIEAFVGVERTDEAQHRLALQAQLVLRVSSAAPESWKPSTSTALGMTVTLVSGTPRATISRAGLRRW